VIVVIRAELAPLLIELLDVRLEDGERELLRRACCAPGSAVNQGVSGIATVRSSSSQLETLRRPAGGLARPARG
jgi:hypothetical protein